MEQKRESGNKLNINSQQRCQLSLINSVEKTGNPYAKE